eukprot:1730056-Amphidinium_carterae.1
MFSGILQTISAKLAMCCEGCANTWWLTPKPGTNPPRVLLMMVPLLEDWLFLASVESCLRLDPWPDRDWHRCLAVNLVVPGVFCITFISRPPRVRDMLLEDQRRDLGDDALLPCVANWNVASATC